MEPRKEERPETTYGAEKGPIPAPGEPGSENYHYRTLTVDKATEEAGRMDKHAGLGYKVALKQGRQYVVGAPKEGGPGGGPEARIKASGTKSAKRVTQANNSVVRKKGATTRETLEIGKGPLFDN